MWPKKSRREINKENQRYGKEGEEIARRKLEMEGLEVTRTGKGHDFKTEKKDWLTGKTEKEKVEVKTGDSQHTEKQENMKRRHGENYRTIRYKRSMFGGLHEVSDERGGKKESDSAGDDWFGDSSKKSNDSSSKSWFDKKDSGKKSSDWW